MILNANNKEDCQYEIFDANGKRLNFVIRADTETGEIVVPARNSDGKFYYDGYGELVKEILNVPAPLKIVKYEKN